ncbi:g-D-glutamyl-meso-diaminopimelate peptidase [Anaerotaenia torta]|uniref:M14 family zinc carboxypeptidase n=1 Tax=Anaerotaenia torta TaxID=433293 RepID=UPI003D1C2104
MIIDLTEPDFHYDKFVKAAKSLAKQYESILEYVTIGESHDNRDIILLKLGLGQKHLVCCGGVHAREIINPIVLLRITEYYADLYLNYRQQKRDLKKKLGSPHIRPEGEGTLLTMYGEMLYGAFIHELLHTYTILMVPLLNPDGYMIAQKGFGSIRDPGLREQCQAIGRCYLEWKGNARGVDINRNFPSQFWVRKFEGDHPASENETQALIRLFQEYNTSGFLDFHSRGKEIYYYRNRMPDSYNSRQLEIAERLCRIANYELVPPEEEIGIGDSGGNTVHYYSEYFHKPALTIETVEDEAGFPMGDRYRISTFEELKLLISEFGSMLL